MTTLLLHSSGFSGRQWMRLGQRLSGAWHAPDFAGYPGGAPWRDGAAWAIDTDLAVQFIDHSDEPVDLVGHSYGALWLLAAAARRPERVRRLVLHDPVIWGLLGEDGGPNCIDTFQDLMDKGMLDESTGGSRDWMETFIDFWNGSGAWNAMAVHQQAFLLSVGRKVFREVWDLFSTAPNGADYDAVVAPMCIVMGQASPIPAQRVGQILANRLPQRERVPIPAGHMAPVTHSGLFNQVALEFLQRTS